MTCSIPREVKYRSLKSLLTQIKLSSFWTDKTVRITSSTSRYLTFLLHTYYPMRYRIQFWWEKINLFSKKKYCFIRVQLSLLENRHRTSSLLPCIQPVACTGDGFEAWGQTHARLRETAKASPCAWRLTPNRFIIFWVRGQEIIALQTARRWLKISPRLGEGWDGA